MRERHINTREAIMRAYIDASDDAKEIDGNPGSDDSKVDHLAPRESKFDEE